MLFKATLFSHPGSLDHDYQDAASFNEKSGYAAIADGATISALQGEWAQILTQYWIKYQPFFSYISQSIWWDKCKCHFEEIANSKLTFWKENPSKFYYTKRLYDMYGASAAFIGMRIECNSVSLMSIGDCYAFWFSEFENATLIDHIFPNNIVFNNQPDLLRSKTDFPINKAKVRIWNERPGDCLVLVTDALAEYFVKFEPWLNDSKFLSKILLSSASFKQWVEFQCDLGFLKSDDYTLLLLKFKYLEDVN